MIQGPSCREPLGIVGSGGGKWEAFPLVLRLVPGGLRAPRMGQILDDLSSLRRGVRLAGREEGEWGRVEGPFQDFVSALSSHQLDEELDPDPGPTTCGFFSPSVDRGVPMRLLAHTSELGEGDWDTSIRAAGLYWSWRLGVKAVGTLELWSIQLQTGSLLGQEHFPWEVSCVIVQAVASAHENLGQGQAVSAALPGRSWALVGASFFGNW